MTAVAERAGMSMPRRSTWHLAVRGLILLGCSALVLTGCTEKDGDSAPDTSPPAHPDVAATAGDPVRVFCGACHLFPSPAILPRASWKKTIEKMYEIYEERVGGEKLEVPPLEDVVRHFVSRAPEKLPAIVSTAGKPRGPVEFRPVPRKIAGLPPYPGVSSVRMVHLFDDLNVELLLCEMRFQKILLIQPAVSMDRVLQLGTARHPSHAEVVDLDGDGIRDVLVASLGTVTPSDVLTGSVVWLRGRPGRRFESHVLAEGLGRVADAQVADFDGDGDQDVVVAVFGWRKVGRILWLENRSPEGGARRFDLHEIDPRPGAITVPVTDLNGDGRPDFIALISQEFETVVAYTNLGGAVFESKMLFQAPHPNWGSTSIELVDLDGDGDLDILFSNGDSLDDLLLKNYHGVQWLENTGDLRFENHRLTDLCGAHGARAGDFDGDGDQDIVVGAFLPFVRPGVPRFDLMESLVWLEQVSPGRFERHPLEVSACFHPTLDVGDIDGDGDEDIVVGNMTMAKQDGDDLENWITIWENRGAERE